MPWSLCSNRTFMELKFASASSLALCALGSNRTFMELKLLQACNKAIDK